MKVLFLSIKVVNPTVRDDITYTFIMKEMRALVARGVQVYFYSDAFARPREVEGIRCFGRRPGWGARVQVLATLLRHLAFFVPRFLRSARAAWGIAVVETEVRAALARERIDVIHTHFLWPHGECCELAARDAGVPLLATLRGAELYDEPEMVYGSMRDPLFRMNFASSKQAIAHFTVPNAGLRERLTEQFGVEPSRVSLVFNGVEALDEPEACTAINAPVRFVAIGRFIKRKNYDWLLDALEPLRGRSFVLEIYGFGPEQARLETLIREHGLNQVKLCDEVPKKELVRIIAEADALIHPSRIEGLPNVVLESLVLGTPVFASDIEAHRDIIEHGYNGFLFDLDQPQSFARLIDGAIAQPDRLRRLAPNCRRATEKFSLERKIDRYLQLYDEAIRAAGLPP